MQPLSHEFLFAILFVSFISCVCSLLSGAFLLMLMNELKSVQIINDGKRVRTLIRRGKYLILTSFAFAVFFGTRMALVVQTNEDFPPQQWLLFDIFVGMNLLVTSSYVYSLFRALIQPDV